MFKDAKTVVSASPDDRAHGLSERNIKGATEFFRLIGRFLPE
jgi:hypothetical protein